MKPPTAGELRTKVVFYVNTPVPGSGGDMDVTLTTYRTAWGKLVAVREREAFTGGIDSSQNYDLWVRMDSALPLYKPMTAYANGWWFNVNSIEVVPQARQRWEKIQLTIDRFEQITFTTTT